MIRRLLLVGLLLVTAFVGKDALARPEQGLGALPGAPPPIAPTGVGDTAHLTPALHRAIVRAIAAAGAEGVDLTITSGWRSAAHQQELYDQAVRKYGSPEAASRWVLPPASSAHVRGQAVDVGPKSAAAWLESNGVRFGLCRRYDNEYWHFELLAATPGSTCPQREPHA